MTNGTAGRDGPSPEQTGLAGPAARFPSALGTRTPPPAAPVTLAEAAAILVSLLWLIVSGLYFLRLPPAEGGLGSLRVAITLLAIMLPVAMIWVAAAAARSARVVRDESRRLHAALEAVRQTYASDRRARVANGPASRDVERRLAEIERATRRAEEFLAAFAADLAPAPAPSADSPPRMPTVEQPRLALGAVLGEGDPPLDRADLVRALNFPENERDEAGFAALRRALANRSARVLIQASQDVLTLLSQDGIYMDDLDPDRARPEIWRRFAGGERGGAIAELGGVRDRTALGLTGRRMREDAIFRDAAHHFLRLFDRTLQAFESVATDEDLVRLSETRTARAFMLLGRVAGSFD